MLRPDLGRADRVRRTTPQRIDALDAPAEQSSHNRAAQVRTTLLALASVPLLLLLLLPLVALAVRVAPDQLVLGLRTRSALDAISLSLRTSLATVLVTLVFGTPLAYLLARRRFRGWYVLDTLIDLPMVLPPAVAGIALLMAFGRRGLVGPALDDVGIQLPFTPVAVVLAQTFVAAPFYVKAVMAGLMNVDRELEQAAMIDGANRWQVLRWITAPLINTELLSGAVMTWARALGEFGATIIFAGNFPGRTQTMPLAIYLGFELDLDVALALAAILLVVSFAILFVIKRMLRGHA
jgi:molybdate transport system permease protein